MDASLHGEDVNDKSSKLSVVEGLHFPLKKEQYDLRSLAESVCFLLTPFVIMGGRCTFTSCTHKGTWFFGISSHFAR